MKTQAAGIGRIRVVRDFQIWAFLGILVATLTCSAVVGTQSVRADAACTSTQCSNAYNYAQARICVFGGHGNLINFECPVNGETDDYFFQCSDGWAGTNDCALLGRPS